MSSPPTPAPRGLARVALAAVVVNVAIVLTGGIVRVTGSGLGCSDWPTCDGTAVVPRAGAEAGWHQYVEFGNRLVTFVVLGVAVAAVVAVRRHARDRHDLTRLAWGLPLGVVGQAVLGGLTVLTGLHPLLVASHFLLSMVIIAVAVVLHHRITAPATAVATGRGLRRLAVALVTVAGVILVLGTLVTAAGPHAGDPGTPRLGFDIRTAARFHAGAVWVALAGTVTGWLLARRQPAAPRLRRAFVLLLAVELAQGAIGYAQYLLGIPAWLVALHLLGACLFWVATLHVALTATGSAPTARRAAAVTGRPVAAVAAE